MPGPKVVWSRATNWGWGITGSWRMVRYKDAQKPMVSAKFERAHLPNGLTLRSYHVRPCLYDGPLLMIP